MYGHFGHYAESAFRAYEQMLQVVAGVVLLYSFQTVDHCAVCFYLQLNILYNSLPEINRF